MTELSQVKDGDGVPCRCNFRLQDSQCVMCIKDHTRDPDDPTKCVERRECPADAITGKAPCFSCQPCLAGKRPDFKQEVCVEACDSTTLTTSVKCVGPPGECNRYISKKDGTSCFCEDYTRAQTKLSNNQGRECRPDDCDSNSIILKNGSCKKCEPGTEPDESKTHCKSISCKGRTFLHPTDRTCKECPPYTMPNSDHTNCEKSPCDAREKLNPDGSCSKCPDYQR